MAASSASAAGSARPGCGRRPTRSRRSRALAVVLNTANDLRLHGLRICPDIDTVLYALSGRLDAGRGWGLRDGRSAAWRRWPASAGRPGSALATWTWPRISTGPGCSATGPASPR